MRRVISVFLPTWPTDSRAGGVPDVCMRCKQASSSWKFIGNDTEGHAVMICSGRYSDGVSTPIAVRILA